MSIIRNWIQKKRKENCITVESRMTLKTLLRNIDESSYEYNRNNFFINNIFMKKDIAENSIFLYYTGKTIASRCLYGMNIVVLGEGERLIIVIKKKMRPDIKLLYYWIPIFGWMLMGSVILKNCLLIIMIVLMQIMVSTIVVFMVGKIGEKKQITKVLEFVKEKCK